MRLKKLELFGFKSFADKTEIIFDQGVTCIVGPNGCGKSNLSDSIRWVLGERSAKLLRGCKMEDVIFNGTDFRKPLALAEVSLTIDNADRGLPIDYQEVAITRRLYRSGESEYLINRTVCRLKDIQDLILDTGIGSNSYSMIEQGRIDYILNADADERRFLIEEAAGISKYKVKKEEAIRKLERTEENLLRLKDIVHEVERNIQYAERQARRAERYKEQLEKLKDWEIRKAFYELGALGLQKTEQGQQLTGIKAKILELDVGLAGIQERHHELGLALREISDRQSSGEARRYELRSQFEQNKQQLRFNQEKRRSLDMRQGEISQEKTTLEEQLQKNQRETDEKTKECLALETDKERAQEGVRSAEEVLNALQVEIGQDRVYFEETKTEAFNAASGVSKIRNEFHRLAAFLETAAGHQKRQEAGTSRFQQEIEGWRDKEKVYEEEITKSAQKVLTFQQEKASLQTYIREANEKLENTTGDATQIEKWLHEKGTRLKMLVEIDGASGTDINHLLNQSQTLQKELVRTLREIFTVPEGYEYALEACLGAYAQSLIVDDVETGKRLFTLLQNQSVSPLGILIQGMGKNTVRTDYEIPSHTKLKKALKDLVTVKPEYHLLTEPFLHRVFLLDEVNAGDLVELLALSEENTLISQDGWVLGPYGRIFYCPGKNSPETNAFKRSAEMRSLAVAIAQLEQDKEQIAAQQERLRRDLTQAQERIPQLEEGLMNATIQKESFESMRRGVNDRLASYQRELEILELENQDVNEQRQHALAERNRLENDLAKAEEYDQSLRVRQENLFQEIERMETKKDEALQQLAQHKMRLEGLNDRRVLLQDTMGLLEGHRERSHDRRQFLNVEGEKNCQAERHLSADDQEIISAQAHLEESLRSVDVGLELIRQEKTGVDARLAELQEGLRNFNQQKQTMSEKAHALEMATMDIGYKEKNIFERLEQTYRIDLKQFSPEDYCLRENLTFEDLTAQIGALREKVEGLGTVNLLAIEEYDELKQRYDFLTGQQKDLEDSREALLAAIGKINRTTKGLFEETFAKVQATFKEYYQILFRGGEARLVLIDESNPLESGIDIIVRPPGKKLQHISLLSGGEKALTAIALLFSLFKIKPSPFCVLDEVDAPLDEANIDRFLTVLRTFLDLSQFIIVTHNRKTIGMGDSLFGVTMQEAGVSRLVSVKVNPDVPFSEYPQNKMSEQQNPVNHPVTA